MADAVVVKLPGFTGAAKAAPTILASMVDDTPAGSFGATESSWTLTTRTLALVLAQDVAGGQAVTVTMLSACGLELPSHSLSATQASLQLSFDDADNAAICPARAKAVRPV